MANIKYLKYLLLIYLAHLLFISTNLYAKDIERRDSHRDSQYFIPFHKNPKVPVKGISADTMNRIKQKISKESLESIHVVAQVSKEKKSQFKQFCKAHDIRVKPLGKNIYIVSLPAELIGYIKNENSVRWLGLFEKEEKIHKNILAGRVGEWCKVGRDKLKVVVHFHGDIDQKLVKKIIKSCGGKVIRFYENIQACEALIWKDSINDIADHDFIKFIEEFPAPTEEDNDGARTATGVVTVNASPYDLKGDGITVTVYDTGLVSSDHVDFTGRLTIAETGIVSHHSTHVAGTVGGDGSGSSGRYAGMAPLCGLVSYDTSEDNWDIEYGEAITTYNTDIITNSTYAGQISEYTSTCEIIDNYGKDTVITWSAGNARDDGAIGDAPNIPDFNYHTITGGGKNAKNVILVGAVNDSDEMTRFSSWGPKGDGTMAPIVVAPGYYITSASSVSPIAYNTLNGTSMSSPCVAGICALMLEQYYKTYGVSADPPFPSTVRAIVANTAKDLGHPGPDYQYGFGRIDAVNSVNSIMNGLFNEGSISADEEIFDYSYAISPDQKYLRVTLAWDDEPGDPSLTEHLINDLDLTVISPSGNEYHPLVLDPDNPPNIAINAVDNRNNIEQAVISYPEAGNWTIRVTGTSVNTIDPQSFSIAFTVGTDSTTIIVPSTCATIAEAVSKAQSGDTIYIVPGTYYESNITAPSGVNLIGADFGLGRVVINGVNRETNGVILGNSCTVRNIEIVNYNQGITAETGAVGAIENCIIANNNIGIMALSNSITTITNNNILGNVTGIYYAGSSMSLTNNIIAYNNNGITNSGLSYADENYNDFYNNSVNVSGLHNYGANTIYVNPQFYNYTNDSDYTNDDFVLKAFSLCRHTGNPASTYNNTDGSRNDMGCYGGANGEMFLPIAEVTMDMTLGIGHEYVLHDNGSYDPHARPIVNYLWDLISAPPESSFTRENIINADTNNALFTPDTAGEYVFSLTVTNDIGYVSEPAEITFTIRNGNVLTVASDESGDYTTIASAINAAQGGDTIHIMPGTYYEYNMLIGKPGLKIIGSGWQNTIIDGRRDVDSSSYYIFCPYSNDDYENNGDYTIIEGLTLRNTVWGVRSGGYRVIIQNNLIEDCSNIGVYQAGTDRVYTTIRNNIIKDIGVYGISAANGRYLVYNNIIDHTGAGINIGLAVKKMLAVNNIIQNTTWGVNNYYSPAEYAARFNDLYGVTYSNGYSLDNILQSPRLQTDYTLESGSPCINAGCGIDIFNDVDGSRNNIGVFGGPAGAFNPAYMEWIEFSINDLVPQNYAPILDAIGNKIVAEGDTLIFTVNAVDADGDTLNYSAVGLPQGASFNNRQFSWMPDYSQSGSYQVTFNVIDGRGGTDSETITIVINDVSSDTQPPIVTILEPSNGAITNEDIITVRGSVNEPCTVTVNGNTVSTNASGSFTTQVNLNSGINNILIRAVDISGNSNTANITVEYIAAPIPEEPIPENFALESTVTASSYYDDNYRPEFAIDNKFGIWDAYEWASKGEMTPWIRFRWNNPQLINKVVLYDRSNPTDHIRDAWLYLSRYGQVVKSIHLGMFPYGGSAKVIVFDAVEADEVLLVVTDGVGLNMGLSEFQAYYDPSIEDVGNLALESTVIASSYYDENYRPELVKDNGIGLWDEKEWASHAEMTPWIKFKWNSPHLMNKVVLYDRSNPTDHIRDAWLYFNVNGSRVKSIHLGMFPYGGSAKEVVFDAVEADEVRLVVTDGVGQNIGLSEFQVYYDLGVEDIDNFATECRVITSSTYNVNYRANFAIDNKFGIWDAYEWASKGEMTPWIKFKWNSPRLMNKVVLYDRSNPIDHIRDAWLYFNVNGSRVKSIHLGMFPYGGSAKEVVFDAVEADEVRLVVTDGVGQNIGLSEFKTYYDN